MKRTAKIVSIFACILSLVSFKPVYADDTVNCSQDSPSQVNALIVPEADTPNIYVRALLQEDQGPAHLYFQGIPGGPEPTPCYDLGPLTLTANWQKTGVLPGTVNGIPGTLILTLPNTAPGVGSGGPQAILTHNTPPCDLGIGCTFTYQGKPFELSPKKVSTSVDVLEVGVLTDPLVSKIKEVIYSVDNVQVYTSKELEPFNMRYVPGGEHTIERTVIFNSGQTLSDQQKIQHGDFGQLNYYFTALYIRYSKLILVLGGLATLLLVWVIFMAIARSIYRRRLWRATHIAGAGASIVNSKVGAQDSKKFDGSVWDSIRVHKKIVSLSFGLVVAVFLSFSYIINVFTVDGVSMETTLHDKTKHPLYVLPAEWGKITGSGYTPKRGTIVVVQKDENNLFSTAVEQKSYVVKRIVGLPGERVTIKNNVISIYNKAKPEGFVPDEEYKWTDIGKNNYFNIDITLKQGEVFVVGDHREESIDSRFYGPVKTSQLVGQVLHK